jgi:hypothetical protein
VNGSPTLKLSDGGTATYIGGSGTNVLTFSHTVASGQNSADLGIVAVNLGTASVIDKAGNAINWGDIYDNTPGTLHINSSGTSTSTLSPLPPTPTPAAPTIASVTATGIGISNGAGDLDAGHVVKLLVKFSEPVSVSHGVPTLSLNDGGTASYKSGSGTDLLTFSYKVAAGQNTSDLAITGVHLGTVMITDAAGNAANLSKAVTNPAGILQIDTKEPLPPVLTSDATNANHSVTVVGTAEGNSAVTVYDNGAKQGTTVADSNGQWHFTTGVLPTGSQVFNAKATDGAGNTSVLSASLDRVIGQATATEQSAVASTNNSALAAAVKPPDLANKLSSLLQWAETVKGVNHDTIQPVHAAADTAAVLAALHPHSAEPTPEAVAISHFELMHIQAHSSSHWW